MKITLRHVNNLLCLMGAKGIINGSGQTKERFCVQQAVHRVITDELDEASKSDGPPNFCVLGTCTSLGIHLNDQEGWPDNNARAEGLKRFAVAELGSNNVNEQEFWHSLTQKLAKRTSRDADEYHYDADAILEQWMEQRAPGYSRANWMKLFADLAADTLKELGSEGGQFLYLIDEPDKEKRRTQALKMGHKIFAAQMADDIRRWGTDSDFGLPIRDHHRKLFPRYPAVKTKK